MIDIIKEYFGMTTRQAKEYMKNTDTKILQEIKKGFENNAKLSFMED